MMVDYAGTVKINGARILALSMLLYNADNSVIVIGIIDAKTSNMQ